MIRTIFPILLFALLLAAIQGGCTLANRHRAVTAETRRQAVLPEGRGRAYLFDIKIDFDGRRRSARLDLYQSGDSIGFYTRAYLGKGVMKGLIQRDSALIYFPTEDRFFKGELSHLVTDSCLKGSALEALIMDCFRLDPNQMAARQTRFYLTVLEEKNDRASYRLDSRHCRGGIILKYDRQGEMKVLSHIEYRSDSGSFRFEARRRNFRGDVTIPAEKFQVIIPAEATAIEP